MRGGGLKSCIYKEGAREFPIKLFNYFSLDNKFGLQILSWVSAQLQSCVIQPHLSLDY